MNHSNFRAGYLLLFALPFSALADVGYFESAKGLVSITRNTENIKVRSGTPVFSGDSVTTASFSNAQLKMVDDSTLLVDKNSTLKIDQFLANQSAPEYTFARGTVRYVGGTPKPGTPKPLINTLYAKIADEGTDYTAAICSAGCTDKHGLYLSVESGAVTLSNAIGSLMVPAGTFAFVELGKAPVKLPNAPAVLINAVASLSVINVIDDGTGAPTTAVINSRTPTTAAQVVPAAPALGPIERIVESIPIAGPVVEPIIAPIAAPLDPVVAPLLKEIPGSPS